MCVTRIYKILDNYASYHIGRGNGAATGGIYS